MNGLFVQSFEMKVLLLGAGASKAYRESKSGLCMPIAKDFFETFGESSLAEERWVLTGAILTYLRDFHGIPVELGYTTGLDIEALHSEVESRLLASLEALRSDPDKRIEVLGFQGIYVQLIFMFAALINLVQNGPVSLAHCKLAKLLVPDDVIITFNWDTLMDRALYETTSWCVDSGYGFNPHRIYRNEWQIPSFAAECQAPVLLKLHGSSNWLTSYLKIDFEEFRQGLIQTAPSERVHIFQSTLDPYATFAGRWMAGYERFSYGYYPPNIPDDPGMSAPNGFQYIKVRPKFPWMPESSNPTGGIESSPLIIPPVKQKTYTLFGRLFDTLWERAEEALIRAKTITLIGYSFPITDTHSRDLFTRAFCKRSCLPRITLVDPEPRQAFEFLHGRCGVPASQIRIFEGDEGFFSSTFDMDSLWV